MRRVVPQLARVCVRRQSTSPGPNESLVQMLSECMAEEKASASSNSYKVRAYSKAISAIGQLPEQVRSVDQVKDLDGIGSRIAKRIGAYLSGTPYEPAPPRKVRNSDRSLQEHAKTNLRKTIDALRREEVVSSLSSISGVGPSKANALYDAGCRSLQDLEEPKFFQILSHLQQINFKYMISSDHRASLEQASAVRDFVSQNISSKFTVLLGGDLRRGTASTQRITLVVFHPQTAGIFPPEGSPSVDSTVRQRGNYHAVPDPFANHSETNVKPRALLDTTAFMAEIISPLKDRGFIATAIATGSQKWDGIIRIPERSPSETSGNNGWETRAERTRAVQNREGQFFRAEICYVPRQSAGAALIALTGDNQFNLAIRRAASQLGLRLNEYGLWRWRDVGATTGGDDSEKQRSTAQHDGYWELVAGEREEDIFEAVRMEWVPPERRNFVNLDGGRRQKRKTEGDV